MQIRQKIVSKLDRNQIKIRYKFDRNQIEIRQKLNKNQIEIRQKLDRNGLYYTIEEQTLIIEKGFIIMTDRDGGGERVSIYNCQ